MKKSVKLSIVASAVVASTLNASQSISIEKGWNLIGTSQDIDVSQLDSTRIAWAWDNNWSVKDFSNSSSSELSKYNTLSTIKSGDGFWVYSDNVQTLSLDGTPPQDTKLSIKKGWQLKSIKDNSSLLLDSFKEDDNITSVWGYKNNKWQLYLPNITKLNETIASSSNAIEKLSSIEYGQGFWVNSGSDISDIIASATLITGSINLEGLEDSTTSSGNAKILYNTLETPPTIPALVQVYDTSDTNYEEPLLKEPIEIEDINQNANYNITKDDFLDQNKTDNSNGFIVRAIVEKENSDGTKVKYDLSALKTQGAEVEVSPITTAVKAKILQTIKTLFGEKFKLDSNIMDTVNTLSVQISTKVKNEVKEGKLSLKPSEFITTAKIKQDNEETEEEKKAREEQEKQIRQEQEAKMSLQLASSDASKQMSVLSNQLGEIKKDDLKDKIDDNLKATDILKNEDLARLQFDIITKFAEIGLSVHNGTGSIILYLPVPPEEFNTLPGKRYQINIKNENNESITIGENWALRVIDIEKDLKNIIGNEIWLPELKEKLLNMPIVPFNAIIEVLKNIDNTITLEEFGNYLASDDVDNLIKFPENPFLNLYGTNLSQDIDQSVENILINYKNSFILQDFDWIFNDQLNKVLMQSDIADENTTADAIMEFIDTFKAPQSLDETTINDFLVSIEDKASNSIDDRFHHLFNLIADGIPYNNEDENSSLLQFKNDLNINKDSQITISTALTLLNLAMDTRDIPTLESISITDLTSPEGRLGWLPDNIKGILNDKASGINLVVATYEEEDNNISTDDNNQLVMKKFITDVVSKVTGVNIVSEPSFTMTLANINKISEKLKELAKEQEQKFFEEQFYEEIGNPFFEDAIYGQKDTVVSFEILNFMGITNTAVSSVVFTPMLENKDTFQWIESNNSVIFTKENNIFENNITLYDKDINLDEFGNIEENGKYRQTEMFKVKVYQGTESFKIGEFPIFAQPHNDLNKLVFDSKEMFYDEDPFAPMADNEMMMPNETHHFQEFAKNSQDILFYPNFVSKNNGEHIGEHILTFNNHKFNIADLKGTLENAEIKMFILAKNYDEGDNIWMSGNFMPKPELEPISEFTIGSNENEVQQGGLILIKVISEQLEPKDMIISIDNFDEEFIGVSLMDVPYMDMADIYSDPDNIFDDVNTTVKFKVKKFNGLINQKVKSVTFNPWVVDENGEWQHIPDGYKAIINPIIGGAFKGNISIKSEYDNLPSTGMFEVTVRYIDENGDEQNNSIGDFPLFPSSENFLGDIFFDMDIDNYMPTEDGEFPMDDMMMNNKILPEDDMNTSVNLIVTNQDGEPNYNVKSINIIPVLENIDTKEWKPTYFLGKDTNLSTNAELNTTILLKPENKIFEMDEGKWVYTGQFEFVATMDDNKTFPVGQFPLFAQPDNNLTWFTVDASWIDNSDDFNPDDFLGDIKEDIQENIENKIENISILNG